MREKLRPGDVLMKRARSAFPSAIRIVHQLAERATQEQYGMLDGAPPHHVSHHVARYVVSELTECSSTAIGRALGIDHATVLYSIDKGNVGEALAAAKRTMELLEEYECPEDALPTWQRIAIDNGWTPPAGTVIKK